jgi:hypothetical protein
MKKKSEDVWKLKTIQMYVLNLSSKGDFKQPSLLKSRCVADFLKLFFSFIFTFFKNQSTPKYLNFFLFFISHQ